MATSKERKKYGNKGDGKSGNNQDSKSQGRGKYSRPDFSDAKGGCNRGKRITEEVSNDISYYNKQITDLNVAANFPWFKVIGQGIRTDSLVSNAMAGSSWKQSVINFGGIMAIDFVPGIGISTDVQSPVNRAFAQIMAGLYAKTSSNNLNFQQADLTMEQVSLASISNLIGYARRALGSCDFWINKNNFYPRRLLEAMGFSWSDITTSKATYVARLNSIIAMFNNIKIPLTLDVFKRQFALCHNIYVDEDDAFGQIYFFRPKVVYAYVDTESKCVAVPLNYGNYNKNGGFGLFLDLIQSMLDRWYNSSDLYIINGAMLRAYPDTPSIVIEGITDGYMISPTTDKYILLQIMNADIFNYEHIVPGSLDITQDVVANAVLWKPILYRFTSTADADYPCFTNKLLRSFGTDHTIEDNVEMTRLCATVAIEPTVDGNFDIVISSCNTEFVCGVEVYWPDKLSNTNMVSTSYTSNFLYEMDDLLPLMSFRFLPPFMCVSESEGSYTMLGDIYNYTTLDARSLKELNRVCMLSMFTPVLPTGLNIR